MELIANSIKKDASENVLKTNIIQKIRPYRFGLTLVKE